MIHIVGSQVWRAYSVHWSVPFYVGDLSILQIWVSVGVLKSILSECWETTKFWGVKSYTWILDCVGGLAPVITVLFEGQLYLYCSVTSLILNIKDLSRKIFFIIICTTN